MPRKFDIRAMRQYAELDQRRRELDDELTRLKAEMKEQLPSVLKYFGDQGIDAVKMDGLTLSIRRELWAAKVEGVETAAVIDSLHAAGLGEYAPQHVNWQSLSALVREWDRDQKPVPPGLADVLRVAEQFKVSSRKSA